MPEALVESRRKPERERLLEKRLVEVSPVVDALVMVACVLKRVATVPTVVEDVLSTV